MKILPDNAAERVEKSHLINAYHIVSSAATVFLEPDSEALNSARISPATLSASESIIRHTGRRSDERVALGVIQ